MNCPCGSEQKFSQCCEPVHKDFSLAKTPEQLMRARYSAFATKNLAFIAETLDPQTRDSFNQEENAQWALNCEFTGLQILNTAVNGNKGTVEFQATFKDDKQETIYHEMSQFRRQQGCWYFRKGLVLP